MHDFSVVIPTFRDREHNVIIRAIRSIVEQTYQSYEIIVVDDGSPGDYVFNAVLEAQHLYPNRFTYIRQTRQQRLIARNVGLRAAKNEWIVLMDDDDELYPDYLKEFNTAIGMNNKYFVYNCAAQFYKVIDGVERKLRVLPPMKLADTAPWPHFRSGSITMGQFVFNKECLNKTGYYPHTHLYGDFAVMSGIPGYGWIDAQPPRFPDRRVQVLGNPWGEDYWLFYKLTRYYDVFPIQKTLYKKNCR